jgi:hypothetical protein
MQMAWLRPFSMLLLVAHRELTSIFRGRAERFLLIWTPLFFVPLLTIVMLSAFLVLRTSELLDPMRVSISRADATSLGSFVETMKTFPDVRLLVEDDPNSCYQTGRCNAQITLVPSGHMKIKSDTDVVRARLTRAVERARMQVLEKIAHQNNVEYTMPMAVVAIPLDQFRLDAQTSGKIVLLFYGFAYLYVLVWLIPAIDIIRFDFQNDNLFANLSLPVRMFDVVAGKLVAGVIITLVPTILSVIAIIGSGAIAVAAAYSYYVGDLSIDAFSFAPAFSSVPLLKVVYLPPILLAATAFLYAWLMMIVYLFKGQRMAFFLSINSLVLVAPLALIYGATVPLNQFWPAVVPFFSLAVLARLSVEQSLTATVGAAGFGSTLAGTIVLIWAASKFYRLEPRVGELFGGTKNALGTAK